MEVGFESEAEVGCAAAVQRNAADVPPTANGASSRWGSWARRKFFAWPPSHPSSASASSSCCGVRALFDAAPRPGSPWRPDCLNAHGRAVPASPATASAAAHSLPSTDATTATPDCPDDGALASDRIPAKDSLQNLHVALPLEWRDQLTCQPNRVHTHRDLREWGSDRNWAVVPACRHGLWICPSVHCQIAFYLGVRKVPDIKEKICIRRKL